MDEDQELMLQAVVATGRPVYWLSPRDGIARKILVVGPHSGEPSLAAYFEERPRGDYVALYNCGWDEFYLMQPVFVEQGAPRPVEMIDRAP